MFDMAFADYNQYKEQMTENLAQQTKMSVDLALEIENLKQAIAQVNEA